MPITFTKEEIKEFLKEEGYEVNDEQTLRKFIHDFKKLIKFEEMKRRRRKLGHHPEDTILDSTDGRHQHTTTSTQETSSYEEGYEDFTNKSRHNQEQKSPHRLPPSSGRTPVREPSPAKKSPVKALRSPSRQHKKQPQRTGETRAYETDETSSYENYDSVDTHQRLPVPKPAMPIKRAQPAPFKKQEKRLIMKRVTASQGTNGDSLIEESDVDLGPRRPTNRPTRRPPPKGVRPQTAPAVGGEKSSRPVQSAPRPISARSQQELEENDCDVPEPDELFHALNELIFPNDQMESQDSLFAESDKPKTLLKPPPHVARDPVLLYHWYKTYNWDVYSIPGEDRHMKLRWNVRAKTVGGYHPCIEARNFYKPKSYCC